LVADEEVFGERLPSYIGKPPFEEICLQYLQRANRSGKLPFTALSFGSWWGNDPKDKAQADFDVIAANKNGKKIVLGECKWRGDVNLAAEAKKLKEKDHLLAEYNERYYYIFSRVPVRGKANGVTVVTSDSLFDFS